MDSQTTVLLIEDSRSDARLIAELLNQSVHNSFNVLTASTLAKGIEILSTNSVDVVLLDLGLPDSQGIATLHAVCARAPQLPIIVLTVSDDDTIGLEAIQEGAQRFLSKDALTLGAPYAGVFSRMLRFAIEQKRIEEALVQSERQYRQLVDTANVIILTADPKLTITYCNDYTLKLLGYNAEEFIGMPVVGTLLPETETTGRDLKAMARDVLDYPERYAHNRNEVMIKDGRRLWIEWTNTLRYDTAGNYSGVLSMGIDITERKQAEDALQEAQEEMQALNEELQSTNEELRVANETLEYRVQERTEELASINEKLHSTNEELRVLNQELRYETEELKRAEKAAQVRARNTALLNKIIKHGNSAADMRDFLKYVCDTLSDDLGFDAVDMRIITDTDERVAEQVAVTGFPSEFNEKFRYMSVDDPILCSVYRGEPYFPARYAKTHLDLVQATNFASIAIVPLAVGETIIGDMGLALKDYRPFSLEEQAFLVAIGHESGTVVARLQAEEQVRSGSRYVRSLIEASLDPLVTISAEGIVTDVNRATEEVTGHSRDELIGSDFSDYFTEPQKARAGYKQVFTDAFVRDYPLAIRHESGAVTDVLYNASVYCGEAGEVLGVFAAARDITDRKRAEDELLRYSDHLEDLVEERTAQLAQSEEEFRTLFEASSVGQIYYGADGHPLRINHAAASFFGINDVRDIQHLTIFSSPQTTEGTKARLRAGHPIRYEHVYDFKEISERGSLKTTRSDVRRVDLHMLPVFSTSGDSVKGYLAQLIDITDRKRMEEALQDAQRLAGIGQTAAMIGHDLRNPLQGLQYIVDLQKLRFERMPSKRRDTEDWEKEQALFDRISEQIFYMDKIVGDLQDYARPITPEHEELKLSVIIDDVLEALPPADGIETVIEVSELTFHADSHFMLRVFSNLILNAVQAMQHGGTLTISAEAFDDSVAIRVSDTGVGIPADMRDKIFSPLTTGKAKGTGLGLAVVKRIVEAHNGTISFESTEGKGTTFIVTLPQTDS
ncbi:MAG: PAS domain S-box protein [Halobacteriota archaeon]